jgi:hypothetical protein
MSEKPGPYLSWMQIKEGFLHPMNDFSMRFLSILLDIKEEPVIYYAKKLSLEEF